MVPLPPTSQNDPSGLGRVETFWNSFSCDRSIAALQSVPAFLLSEASVGPRSSGEVARQHASGRRRGAIRFRNILPAVQRLNSPAVVRQSGGMMCWAPPLLALHRGVLFPIQGTGEVLQDGLHGPRVYPSKIKHLA
jgi:hypothetical protein